MRDVILAIGLSALLGAAPSLASDENIRLRDFAEKVILAFDVDPFVIERIRLQNERNAALGQSQIQAVDQAWRDETYSGGGELIDAMLGNDVSSYLKQIKRDNAGVFTELFIMDSRGLNVGQSDVTSDYWQGDEAKWQETFLVGPNAIHISDVEFDESTQTYQVQASRTLCDPADQTILGAITIGINVDALP